MPIALKERSGGEACSYTNLYQRAENRPEQDYSTVERGRGAGTQVRSESGPYRRDCAGPNIGRLREAMDVGTAAVTCVKSK